MVEIVASRRRGRPSKGPRAVVKALVPPELKEAAASTAKARGMTANDYIAALIAADTGLTELMASIREKQAATPIRGTPQIRAVTDRRSGP